MRKKHSYKLNKHYTILDLKKLYPTEYPSPAYIIVKKEIAACLLESHRYETALARKDRYHAVVLLGELDGEVVDPRPSVEEQAIRKIMLEGHKRIIYDAINQLTEKQIKRKIAKYYLGMSTSEIAAMEGVDESSIRESLKK
ncbi:hypothetical protein LJC07_08425 [Christensenellaceae bacterium OttesenSCG-928-L17]|nr:hypothetical protein [Christensenellaceae bacterium OttesenSCG-928-L17]